MPYDNNPPVDWSTGAVLLRDGSIFCSPNSKRAVLIPDPEARANPFQTPITGPLRTEPLDFDPSQPVWWDWNWGWIAFIPMSPSFLSLPFQPLCWKPRITETFKMITLPSGTIERQRRYTLHGDDYHQWISCQQQILRAADLTRMFHHIPGTMPPLPSSFGLNGLHRSRNVAERCINAFRKSFVVWMGFLSYLIAQTTRPEYQKPSSGPLPCWYNHLLEKGFAPPWLDGLVGSSVCAFDFQTVRSGVLFSFTDNNQHRPPAQWFIAHQIPCWYPLSRFSEEYMKKDRFLQKLIPPSEMLQEVLTKLFVEPRLPLVLFIIKGFRDFDWDDCGEEIRKILDIEQSTSAVMNICLTELARHNFRLETNRYAQRDHLLREMKTVLVERENIIQSEISAGKTCLEQGMIDKDDFDGMTTLHADWSHFFERRMQREAELLLSETDKERQARLQREENPPIKKCKMYVWKAVKTSGGRILYARTLAKQREHEDLAANYKSSETKFNARLSEWDFFEEFSPDNCTGKSGSDSESDKKKMDMAAASDASADKTDENEMDEPTASDTSEDKTDENKMDEPTANDVPMDTQYLDFQQDYIATIPVVADDTMEFYATAAVEDYPPHSPTSTVIAATDSSNPGTETRIIERARLQFGFVPPLVENFVNQESTIGWREVLHILGSLGPTAESVSSSDKAALQAFFSPLIKKATIPIDLDDLSDHNRSYLLSSASLELVKPFGNWFIFHVPHSTTTNWFLGVDSAAAALYILRIMAATHTSHSTFTLGNLLIRNGVRFRTFEKLSRKRYYRICEPFRPHLYRQNEYKFTAEDFQASLLQTKYVLQTLPGRAALLEGGIIGRVAREFLQADSVLDGPSVEATYSRSGLCVDAEDDENEYWDDELSERERAIICGTYIMYTG